MIYFNTIISQAQQLLQKKLDKCPSEPIYSIVRVNINGTVIGLPLISSKVSDSWWIPAEPVSALEICKFSWLFTIHTYVGAVAPAGRPVTIIGWKPSATPGMLIVKLAELLARLFCCVVPTAGGGVRGVGVG